jgi:RNA polymerase sigma factor (sigma-70 family)
MAILTDLTNEQIAEQINKNINVVANMELLYTRNLNYIKKILRPIADSSGEDIEDLLQESYFSLRDAVSHYEPGGGAQFLTYATYWIKRGAFEYVRKCSLLYVPAEVHNHVIKYKKTVSDHERDFGVSPNSGNMSKILNIDKQYLDKIKVLASGVGSLDAPLAESDGDVSFTVGDTLAADLNVEDSAIDAYMDEQRKTELWAIVERTVNERENAVIRAFFIDGMNLSHIGEKFDISAQRVEQIKRAGLNRLRRGKARKELEQRFDELGGRYYHNGLCTFKRTFESNVQRLAFERISAQEKYKATTDLICQIDLEAQQARKKELDAEYQRLLQELENND